MATWLWGIIIVISSVVMYVTSYYMGPGLLGYQSVPISLLKALGPLVIVGIVLAIRRARQ